MNVGRKGEVQVRVSGRPLGASKLGLVFPPPFPSLQLLLVSAFHRIAATVCFISVSLLVELVGLLLWLKG